LKLFDKKVVNIINVHRKSSYVIGVDSETASPSI